MFFRKILLVGTIFVLITFQASAIENKTDYFGYYIPKKEFRVGNFQLDDLAIARSDDVQSYKFCKLKDKSLSSTFAPVILEFSDITSKEKVNSLGQTYHANSPRVLPQTCRIAGNTLSFVGRDKQIGDISFVGTLNLNALKIIHGNPTVLKGNLTVGRKTYKNIEFGWFGGD